MPPFSERLYCPECGASFPSGFQPSLQIKTVLSPDAPPDFLKYPFQGHADFAQAIITQGAYPIAQTAGHNNGTNKMFEDNKLEIV